MNAAMIQRAVEDEARHASTQVLEYGERLYVLPRLQSILEAVAKAPGAEDVRTIALGIAYCTVPDNRTLPCITLYLKRQDSPLVREIVKLLHIPFDKQPAGDALMCVARIGEVILQVANYLPESCVVEYHDEYIPGHMAKMPKVVCRKENGE